MKTLKVFYMLAVLFLFAAGNASAQTKQVKWDFDAYLPNPCTYEWISGPVTMHVMMHFIKNGDVDWMKIQAQGELESETGEIFKVSFIGKADELVIGGTIPVTIHFNLVGDKGSHVLYSITFEVDQYGHMTILSEKEKCF